jgi:uncharacterized protein YaiL (DUF2058 family)
MQNLRDKLLKAGLVTSDQVKKAEEKPKPRQQQRPGPKPLSAEEQQARDAFAAREAEVSEERRRDAAKAAESKMQSERARSLRALVEEQRLRDSFGEAQFHFVRRSGKVGRLLVTPAIAKLLEEGAAAVVENPGQPDPVVLPAEAAKRAYKIDPRAIFFWNGPQKPIGFDDPEPAPGESEAAKSESVKGDSAQAEPGSAK